MLDVYNLKNFTKSVPENPVNCGGFISVILSVDFI